MRTPILVVLATALLAGCAPGRDDDLREAVDRAAPTGSTTLGCEWGKSWGSGSGAYYDCFYLVKGKPRQVARRVLARLREQGFIVSCREQSYEIEMLGAREETAFFVDVLGHGFIQAQNVSASDVDLPPGHVLVELAAIKGEADDVGPPPGYLCA